MVKMTHEQELNLERFANFMADMIEKYGLEIDLEQLNNKDKKAGIKVVSASFCVGVYKCIKCCVSSI